MICSLARPRAGPCRVPPLKGNHHTSAPERHGEKHGKQRKTSMTRIGRPYRRAQSWRGGGEILGCHLAISHDGSVLVICPENARPADDVKLLAREHRNLLGAVKPGEPFRQLGVCANMRGGYQKQLDDNKKASGTRHRVSRRTCQRKVCGSPAGGEPRYPQAGRIRPAVHHDIGGREHESDGGIAKGSTPRCACGVDGTPGPDRCPTRPP